MLKQCWRFGLEVSVEAVPNNTKKAKKARSAKKFVELTADVLEIFL